MKLFECNLDKDIETTCIADEIFNPSNEYTGVAFRGSLEHFNYAGLIKLIIIAGIETEHDYNWQDSVDYCTMTDIKNYLCTLDNGLIISKNPNGLGWINEIKKILTQRKIDKSDLNVYKRFRRKYQIHIQKTNEYQSYGNSYHILYLEGFILECKLFSH